MAQKKRLAENLLEEGIITRDQLQNALSRQLMMGGKIGTNLLELRYVSEEQIDKVLSKIYMVPSISPEMFLDITPDVISSIPKELAVKYKIVPIKREHKHIILAMENPNDLKVMDEISFVTGCRISPIVASEVRIALALESYYGHPRDLRYIEISKSKNEFVIERNQQESSVKAAPAAKDHGMVVTGNDSEDWLGGSEEQAKQPESKSNEDYWLSGNAEELEPVTDYYTKKEPQTKEAVVAPLQVASKPPAPTVSNLPTFKETITHLLSVESRDDAIKVVLDYISQYAENVIFFVVSAAEAKAWNGKCKGIDPGRLSELKMNFGGPSIFLTVKNSEQPFFGDISGFPFDDEFLDHIGRTRPLKVCLVPISVKTRVVAMLYVDNNGKEITKEKSVEINSLMEKLSISFEILILKKKTEAKK